MSACILFNGMYSIGTLQVDSRSLLYGSYGRSRDDSMANRYVITAFAYVYLGRQDRRFHWNGYPDVVLVCVRNCVSNVVLFVGSPSTSSEESTGQKAE